MIASRTARKIKKLRQRGLSVPEISGRLLVPKSTVLRHIKGVKILPEHYERWLERRNASKIISERNWLSAAKKAEKLISKISAKELALVASTLYWAEGSKKDFSFSNTDSEMVRVFVNILRNVFGVKNNDLKISLRIYEDLDKKDCLRHWSRVTGIRLGSSTSINILKGFKKGKLKYGMCRVRVRKAGSLFKEFFSIIKRVSILSPS